jgi:hypothetical protein
VFLARVLLESSEWKSNPYMKSVIMFSITYTQIKDLAFPNFLS